MTKTILKSLLCCEDDRVILHLNYSSRILGILVTLISSFTGGNCHLAHSGAPVRTISEILAIEPAAGPLEIHPTEQ